MSPGSAQAHVGSPRYESRHGPDPATLPSLRHGLGELVVATRRFQHRLEVAMDQALEGFAVTFAQYRALEAITTTPRMHVSALSRKLRLTRQATQAVVTKLVRADYVSLHDHGCVKTVHITQRGGRHLRLLRDSASRIPRALEEALDHDERAALHDLLRVADEALEPPRRPTVVGSARDRT